MTYNILATYFKPGFQAFPLGVSIHWTGLLDWTTRLNYRTELWTGLLDWTIGLAMDYWTGLLDWTTGLDYWTGRGLLDWTTGLTFLPIKIIFMPCSYAPLPVELQAMAH